MELPILYKFGAEWCPSCVTMDPNIDVLEEEFENKVMIQRVDVDEFPDIAEKFEIRSIPALVLVDGNDKEILRMVGGKSLKALRESLLTALDKTAESK